MSCAKWLCCVAVTAGLSATTGRADIVTRAYAAYGDGSLTTVEHFGTGHASATLSYTSPGLFTGESEAWAAYGLVGARASISAVNTSYDINIALADARFSDVLTITGGSGPGFVVYEYTLIGATIGDEHEAHAHIFLYHQGDPDEELAEDVTEGGVFASVPHSFTFGTGFETGILLTAAAHVHHGHTGFVAADFEAGAMLTGFSVFDSGKNPITAFSVASQSGTSYPLPGPGTATVFLAAAMLCRRSR